MDEPVADWLESLPGYLELDDLERFKICNGCGAANSKFDFVPDTILGLSIREACFRHDYAYFKGKTEEDKARADRQFLENMMTIINTKSTALLKLPRRRIALTYYSAVCDLGEKAFWEGKERPANNYLHA